ncbi:PaaI family thioesterase [Halomonas kalidii]|uniref:PaaI family thioesterase n=1 Tax=Halomonas kalidii TaxID=3043293 RepID=A0ABT6VLJ5_9GAMM|nr:PaaI family thioesterase [Halomonas kalidii]MDI5934835.1 PaaI family thioesterase [Halomonas kalidii]
MTIGQTPSDADWRRALTRFVTVIPHTRELGLEVLTVTPPVVTMRLPWCADLLGDSARGLVHGGVLTMLLDTVCGSAVLCALPAPEVCPTLDLRVDHYRPGVAGRDIFAEARVLRVTASVVFTEGTLWQEAGRPLARGIGNFVRLGPRNTPQGFAEALFAGEDDHA